MNSELPMNSKLPRPRIRHTYFSCPGLQDLECISKGLGKKVRPQFLHSSKDFLLKSSNAWALYSSMAACKSLPKMQTNSYGMEM